MSCTENILTQDCQASLDFANATGSEYNNNSSTQGESVSQLEELEESTGEFLPISAKEEADFRRLMQECQVGINRAEELGEKLTANLAALDSVSYIG